MKNTIKEFLLLAATFVCFGLPLLAEECDSNCGTSADQLMIAQTNSVAVNCQNSNTNSALQSEAKRMKMIRRQRFVDGLSYTFLCPLYGLEDGIINISNNTEHLFQVLNNLVLAIPMCTVDYLICGTLKTVTLGHFWNDSLIFHITGMDCHFY